MSQPLFPIRPYDWSNSDSADVFSGCGQYSFNNVGVGVILWNGSGIQGRNFFELFQVSRMAAGCHRRNWT